MASDLRNFSLRRSGSIIQQKTNDKILEGVVFNLQRYSIHDGPGIRTTVFLKGCPLKCYWCQNPESQKKEPEILFNRGQCTGCGRCLDACPRRAISLSNGISKIDRSMCTGCGKCAEVCPNEARRLVGRCMTADEVMKEIMRDIKFYENSGGGVTISGGEPTAQPEFALAILKSCQEAGLHTTLDTCGYAPWDVLDELMKHTDFVLYDIKCIDLRKHLNATGVSNGIILENAKLIASSKPMRVRVPLIPEFNDFPEEIRAITHFVKTELGSIDLDLLPYNKMGESKYEQLDRAYVQLKDKGEEHTQTLQDIVDVVLRGLSSANMSTENAEYTGKEVHHKS